MSDLIPSRVPEEWAAWMRDRAEAADTRRHELGAEVAEQPPRWALDALGPVPADDDVLARQEWEHRAGWAAAYRELAGYTDDRDPLGFAPAPGLAEKAAVYRAAHEALGLLDAGAEEADLTDGQLRARYVAYQREEHWAPRDVADELDALHQALAQARTDAEVWAAHADAPGVDEADGARLRADAAAAAHEAEQLAARAAVLEDADEARGRWYVHTAVTRDEAHRSGAELRARGIDPDEPDDRVTGEEWLAAHLAEQADADRDRAIHDEHEMHDPVVGRLDEPVDAAETAVPDVREVSAAHPSERTDPAERRRIPTVDETAEIVERAQVALAEIAARQQAEASRTARAAEDEQLIELGRQAEPVVEMDDGAELVRDR